MNKSYGVKLGINLGLAALVIYTGSRIVEICDKKEETKVRIAEINANAKKKNTIKETKK